MEAQDKAVLRKRNEQIEIELCCEYDGRTFQTSWSPGLPWEIKVAEDASEQVKLSTVLKAFNEAKKMFDKVIARLEREYKQYDKVVSELPRAPE
jgi:hypothetical protein